jgi:hypothetical protein
MNQSDHDAALARAIQRSKVARAKAMPAEQQLFAGIRLFDTVRNRMLSGIRSQFPHWSEADVEAEFRRRLSPGARLPALPGLVDFFCPAPPACLDAGSGKMFALGKVFILPPFFPC